MAFLDFIRNRQQPSAEQPAQQKPETAREMYARQSDPKPLDQLRPADREQAKDLGVRLDNAAQSVRQDTTPQSPSSSDGSSSPEAMRQNMTGQDNAAPSLSPTDAQNGKTEPEKTTASPSREDGQGSQQASQERPKTIERTPPSWER
jgi:hypothetical protein